MKQIISYLIKTIFVFIILFSNSTIFAQKKQNRAEKNNQLTNYVNPFIGTDGHGHTYPGAQAPFGFMQLSPDTRLTGWDGCSGYHYSDTVIHGFSHTHLSGTGCSDYGDILIMPTSEKSSPAKYAYSSQFSHNNETASPGYYSVLMKNNILAELTATQRCGMHRYSFPYNTTSRILVDLEHRDEVLDSYLEIVNSKEIRGMRRSKAWAADQHIYFVIRFSKPIINTNIYINDKLQERNKFYNSKSIKAVFDFNSIDKKSLIVKIGISGVDTIGARLNLEKEIPYWNFDEIRNKTKNSWNKELSKIEVESSDVSKKTIFYSSLYHTFLSPNIYNDVDFRYRGRDNKIHKTDGWNYYTVFSLWDTYRALHPLLTVIDRARTLDFIKTFNAQWEQGGLLPMWELSANETDCMIGYHAVSVIADAYSKGINGFDIRKAFQAMKTSAMQDRLGISSMKNYGYISSDVEHESVSKTLEYGYNDWCIAQIAKVLNENDDYKYFIKRAQAYKNIFDSKTGFMRPRSNGGWVSPFLPTEVNNHYTEANSWQYSFYVPHDINGLIELYGGMKNFELKLDELFSTENKLTGRTQADITGLVGQYAHGNEPSHHIAYLYNYVGRADKAQKMVRRLLNEMYSNSPNGLSGNEDCGQMSAWYVMSALGLYSVCPGDNNFSIGSPIFKKVTINLENGKKFVINAPKNSENNIYIDSAKLNGINYSKLYIAYNQIYNGGEIKYTMSSIPSKNFGIKLADIPSTSIKDYHIVTAPIILSKSNTFKDSLIVTIENKSPNCELYYTTDGTKPNANTIKYKNPIVVKEKTTIKVLAINNIDRESNFSEANFYKIPSDVFVKLESVYNPQYSANGAEGLIDGIKGSENWRLGSWQGYQDADFIAIIDYSKIKQFSLFGASFLQDIGSWIAMPKEVQFYGSTDGIEYNLIGLVKPITKVTETKTTIETLEIFKIISARYIKIIAKNLGNLPEWHISAGEKAFIFVDEVWAK